MRNLTKKECQSKGWIFTTTGQNLITATDLIGNTVKYKTLQTVKKKIKMIEDFRSSKGLQKAIRAKDLTN